MTWPAIVMYLTVACIGLPAAFRNPTAAALVIAWAIPEALWMVTSDSLPLKLYFMLDIAVVSLIYAKTIRRVGPKSYASLGKQLKGLILDLSPCDRLIVALFMLGAWPLYILVIDPRTQWFMLWGIVILQFLTAGAEAVSAFRCDMKSRAASNQGNGLALAGYWGDG